jgi:hypothetical protein
MVKVVQGKLTFDTSFTPPGGSPSGRNTRVLTAAELNATQEVCEIGGKKYAENYKLCGNGACCLNPVGGNGDCCTGTEQKGTKEHYVCLKKDDCTCCNPFDPTANLRGNLIGACVTGCGSGKICITQDGISSHPDICGGCQCQSIPCLVPVKGVNKRTYYTVPASTGTMTHPSAERICRHYGLTQSSVATACNKTKTSDSGHDCPNLINGKILGGGALSGTYHVDDGGTFWLRDEVSTNIFLRVTATCGNNHAQHVCSKYYPLCDGPEEGGSTPTGVTLCH